MTFQGRGEVYLQEGFRDVSVRFQGVLRRFNGSFMGLSKKLQRELQMGFNAFQGATCGFRGFRNASDTS